MAKVEDLPNIIYAQITYEQMITNPHRPSDYRHTDKHLRLLMTPIALC